jgi:hypothetical protein
LLEVSLFRSLGNFLRSPCSAAIFAVISLSYNLKIRIFPEKFPVCREFSGRTARSALRRQPTSPVFGEYYFLEAERPANSGLFRLAESLQRPDSHRYIPKSAASLHSTIEEFPFSGDSPQRPENKTTAR